MFSFCFLGVLHVAIQGGRCFWTRSCTFHDRGFFRSHYWCLDLPSYPFHCVSFWFIKNSWKTNHSYLRQPSQQLLGHLLRQSFEFWNHGLLLGEFQDVFEKREIWSNPKRDQQKQKNPSWVCVLGFHCDYIEAYFTSIFLENPNIFVKKKVGDLCWSSFRGFWNQQKTPAVEKERIDRISDFIEISPLKLNSKCYFWFQGQLEVPDDLTAFFLRMPKR